MGRPLIPDEQRISSECGSLGNEALMLAISPVETPPTRPDVEVVTVGAKLGSAQHSQPASLNGQIVLSISLTEREWRRRRRVYTSY